MIDQVTITKPRIRVNPRPQIFEYSIRSQFPDYKKSADQRPSTSRSARDRRRKSLAAIWAKRKRQESRQV